MCYNGGETSVVVMVSDIWWVARPACVQLWVAAAGVINGIAFTRVRAVIIVGWCPLCGDVLWRAVGP